MDFKNISVYKEKDRYCGWPANYGMWCWDQEIVLSFTLGYMNLDGGFHARDINRPWSTMQARSLDGGLTWKVDAASMEGPAGKGLSADEHVAESLKIGDWTGDIPANRKPVDFTHPDFALMCARTGLDKGAVSWFYHSQDRCQSWKGPFSIPNFDTPGLAARTDILVDGTNSAIFFLTAVKSSGDEGRVFCARTKDGGQSFEFMSWIGPEPAGYAIMPSSARLKDGSILTTIRNRGGDRTWIDAYISRDDGSSWEYLNTPASNNGNGGNPSALLNLSNGRLCMVYGYRDAPYGIRARFSGDGGSTWGDEHLLRDDGGNSDLGYPRAVERGDGKVVTGYYFNDNPEGERYIAATIFDPSDLS